MQFRDIRLGAVFVPIGVATVLISALAWYAFVRVPAREAYLNERNLRLLSTISGAIKAKIESFDGALDHAAASFKPMRDKEALETFPRAVQLFAPDLEILAVDPPGPKHRPGDPDAPETRLLARAADPPRVLIERDEGRYYLYMGAKLKNDTNAPVKIFARADLRALLSGMLDANSEFDAVMVTTDAGEVIAQGSSPSLTLARLDSVIPQPAAGGKEAAPPAPFTTLSSFSNMVPVTIGEVAYKLYMQPISFSLLSMKTNDGERQAEQWVLCGLVRADRFRAESSALSYTTLLWFSGILAIFTLSLSFVKLKAIGARERFRASDARWVTATTFMAVGLLTLGALDIWAFGVWFGNAVDQRLQNVAREIVSRVDAEVSHADTQGRHFEDAVDDQFEEVGKLLGTSQVPTIRVGRRAGDVSCVPTPACKTNVLAADVHSAIDPRHYPFFDLVTWAGTNGWQRVRWTPGSRIRPFVNIFDEKLTYAARAQAAWNAPGATPVKGLDVLSSPTTGEPLTVVWRTDPQRAGGTSSARDHVKENRVQSLAMSTLASLDRPILPKSVSFAVVDKTGLVLFHSVANHRLRENFLKECEDDGRLRALLETGQAGQMGVRYRGHDVRLSVSPLALTAFTKGDDPNWRLLIFQDSLTIDTVNLETVTIACWLFAVYGCLIASFGITTSRLGLQQRHWFWPTPGKQSAYWNATLLNAAAVGIVGVIFRIGAAANRPDATLVATIAATTATAVATYWIVIRARATSGLETFGWRHPFYLARAAVLIVVAALPAAACFHAAYAFETTLLAKDEIRQKETDLGALDDRIAKTVAQIGQPGLRVDKQLARYVSGDTYQPLWDGGFVPADAAAKTETFRSALLWMHRRYNGMATDFASSANEIANDLTSKAAEAMPVPAPPPAPTAGWLLVGLATVFVCCYVFVYWLVRPLFVLSAAVPRSPTAADVDLTARHVLMIGPPGSGKSAALARQELRIFDVATRGWVERRSKNVPVPAERRLAVMGAAVGEYRQIWRVPYEHDSSEQDTGARAAPAAPGGAGWADSFDDTTPLSAMAIDHVDYRLEDSEFASQTLTFVEHAVYRDGCTLQIVSDRDPIAFLRDSDKRAPEADRWVRALRTFQKVMVSVPESNFETAKRDASAAAPYFESLWNACSVDERLALRQLAEEGVVNPQNQPVVRDLMRVGLIVRDPAPRIVNAALREFVLQAASANQISAWERRGVEVPWGTIEVALLTAIVVLAGLLVVTQEQLLNAWIGFIPVLLPVAKPTAETVWKLVSALRPASSDAVAA